jgi:hypothetical protein
MQVRVELMGCIKNYHPYFKHVVIKPLNNFSLIELVWQSSTDKTLLTKVLLVIPILNRPNMV